MSGSGGTAEDEAIRLVHLKAYVDAAARSGGRSVLDIGCNDGYGTVLLARGARRVVGVDVSARAIDVARARPEAAGVEFRLVDGPRLPFPDGTFDLVTAFQVIEHVEDVRSFLLEVRRVAADMGTVLLTTPNAAIRLDPGMAPWNPFHVREFTAPELERDLAEVFPTVRVRGLFAPAAIANLELARSAAARERARRPRRWPVRLALRLLPEAAKAPLRRMASRRRSGDPAPIRQFTTDDLWLADDRLDQALDLHATCSPSPSAGVPGIADVPSGRESSSPMEPGEPR